MLNKDNIPAICSILQKSFKGRKSLDNLGLIDGKMGLCINLFFIGKALNNSELTDYAHTMLNEIFSRVNSNKDFSFSFGLSGIGWGVEHVVLYSLQMLPNITYKSILLLYITLITCINTSNAQHPDISDPPYYCLTPLELGGKWGYVDDAGKWI